MEHWSPEANAAWESFVRSKDGSVQTRNPEGYVQLVAIGLLCKQPPVGDYDRFSLTRAGRSLRFHDQIVSLEASHASNEAAVRALVGPDEREDMIDQVAKAIWAARGRVAARQGIHLEPWGSGETARACGVMEEAEAAVGVLQQHSRASD